MVVAGFIAWNGLVPQPNWVLLLPLVLELYLLIVGVALILSTLFVYLRDIGQIWELGLQLLFYATPIVYPVGFLPPWARDIVFLNPLTQIIQDIRALILYPDEPTNVITAADALTYGRLAPVLITIGIFVVGLLLFRRREPWFAERV